MDGALHTNRRIAERTGKLAMRRFVVCDRDPSDLFIGFDAVSARRYWEITDANYPQRRR